MTTEERRELAYKMFDSRKKYKVKNSDKVGRITSVDHFGLVSLEGDSIYVVYQPDFLEEVEC